MRIHRVHTPQTLSPTMAITLMDEPAHYLGRVLRAAVGQTVVLFNGDGHDYVAEVTHMSRREVVLEVNSRLPGVAESGIRISVIQALSRAARMDQTLQKCTELGAAEFQPLLSERIDFRPAPEKMKKRLDHWRGVVISACEQSGRAIVPPVFSPLGLSDWLEQESPGLRLVLAPGSERSLNGIEWPEKVELVTGPEGGFSDVEMELMQSKGVQAVSLGPRILRTETAAPAAVAVIQALAGDL